jgi:hypothetical protein
MRKLIILFLAFALAACGAPPATPTEPPTEAVVVQPTQTAAVVVQTVVVTVVPTNEPTQVPTNTPVPAPTEVPPTAVPPTQPPAATAVVSAATEAPAGGAITVDSALGAGWFTNITISSNNLALRCQLYKEVTFSVTPTDKNITEMQFYYRIEDRSTGAVFDWQNLGRMLPDANGNFKYTLAGDAVKADFRKPNAWLDFQFVGLSKSGGVVGRSEKIVQQINYMFDCP